MTGIYLKSCQCLLLSLHHCLRSRFVSVDGNIGGSLDDVCAGLSSHHLGAGSCHLQLSGHAAQYCSSSAPHLVKELVPGFVLETGDQGVCEHVRHEVGHLMVTLIHQQVTQLLLFALHHDGLGHQTVALGYLHHVSI